jgi:hypothetical protein
MYVILLAVMMGGLIDMKYLHAMTTVSIPQRHESKSSSSSYGMGRSLLYVMEIKEKLFIFVRLLIFNIPAPHSLLQHDWRCRM